MTADQARAYAVQVARHRGWTVNPAETMTGTLLQGLSTQSERWGKPYCPCRDIDSPDESRDLVCPCAYAAADIGEHGQCFCALFLSPLKDPASVQSIPERRPER